MAEKEEQPKVDTTAPATPPEPPAESQNKVDVWKDGSPFNAQRAMELVEKYETEAKEARKAVKRLAELEAEAKKRSDAELTEVEKLKKENDELKQRLTNVERREMQSRIATKVGLPGAFASRIQGETEDDMETDAKALLAAMPPQVAPKLPPTNPGNPQTSESDADRRKRLGL